MSEGLCDPCSLAQSSPVTILVLVAAVCLLAGLVYGCRRRRSAANHAPGLLQAQLTDNPLSSSSPGSMRQSLSDATVQRTDDAYMLVRVVFQPMRILIGYGQVVNQIGLVLAMDLPPLIQKMFNVLSVLAINLKILQIDCLGDLSFCTCCHSPPLHRLV